MHHHPAHGPRQRWARGCITRRSYLTYTLHITHKKNSMSSDDELPIRPGRSLTTYSRRPGANAQRASASTTLQCGQAQPAQQRIQTRSSSDIEGDSEEIDALQVRASSDYESGQDHTRPVEDSDEEFSEDFASQRPEAELAEAESEEGDE